MTALSIWATRRPGRQEASRGRRCGSWAPPCRGNRAIRRHAVISAVGRIGVGRSAVCVGRAERLTEGDLRGRNAAACGSASSAASERPVHALECAHGVARRLGRRRDGAGGRWPGCYAARPPAARARLARRTDRCRSPGARRGRAAGSRSCGRQAGLRGRAPADRYSARSDGADPGVGSAPRSLSGLGPEASGPAGRRVCWLPVSRLARRAGRGPQASRRPAAGVPATGVPAGRASVGSAEPGPAGRSVRVGVTPVAEREAPADIVGARLRLRAPEDVADQAVAAEHGTAEVRAASRARAAVTAGGTAIAAGTAGAGAATTGACVA